ADAWAATSEPKQYGRGGMHAGAPEWCGEWHHHGYYRECEERGVAIDPQGPDSGEARIVRGGTMYADGAGDLTTINSAARNPQDPITPFGINGFGRVVLPIPAKGQAGSTVPVLNR